MEAIPADAEPRIEHGPAAQVSVRAHSRAGCALTHYDLDCAAAHLAAAKEVALPLRVAPLPLLGLDILTRSVRGEEVIGNSAGM